MTVRQQGRTASARRRTGPAGPVPTVTVGANAGGAVATSTAVPVPSGVAAGDVILVYLYMETTGAVTAPSGFTEVTFSPAPMTATPSGQRVWWKRATGADTGSYTFTHPSTWTHGLAVRAVGCVATGTPFTVLGSATAASSTSTPAVSGTTTGANRMLLWFGTDMNGSTGWTVPAGFTRLDATGASDIVLADKAQVTAGPTGSLTGTGGQSGDTTATLIALLPT